MRFFAALIFSIFALIWSSAGNSQEVPYFVSIENVSVPENNKIIGFELNITAGAIIGLEKLPVGWTYNIDNDASWNTKIQATVMIGAAAVTPEELKNIKLTVSKNETGNVKFHLTGKIYYSEDFSEQNGIALKKEQIIAKIKK